MIVLDSAAAVDYVAWREPGAWVADHIRADPDLHAPHLLDVEVVAALRRLVARRALSPSSALEAIRHLADLDLARYPHLPLVERMWELRAVLTAGDAAFVALAEHLGAVLVTTDARLARAPGIRAAVASP